MYDDITYLVGTMDNILSNFVWEINYMWIDIEKEYKMNITFVVVVTCSCDVRITSHICLGVIR